MTSMTHDNDQHISDTTAPRMTTWERFANTPVGLAITDPRGFVAWKINGVGLAIARLSTRILEDCPSDFNQEWMDGVEYGRRRPRRATTREAMVALFERIGVPTDDATMAKFGPYAPSATS